jgi:hypothetical protein
VGQFAESRGPASPRLPRAFRVFWFGEAVSLFGTATTATLLSLLAATQLDAGPGWMGVLAAATWSPWLILGLPAGALADRWPPRTTMIMSDLIAATAAATVPLLWLTGTLSLPALVAVAFVASCRPSGKMPKRMFGSPINGLEAVELAADGRRDGLPQPPTDRPDGGAPAILEPERPAGGWYGRALTTL